MAIQKVDQPRKYFNDASILVNQGWLSDFDDRSTSAQTFWKNTLCPGITIYEGAKGIWIAATDAGDGGEDNIIAKNTDVEKVIGACYDAALTNNQKTIQESPQNMQNTKKYISDIAILKKQGWTANADEWPNGDAEYWTHKLCPGIMIWEGTDADAGTWFAQFDDKRDAEVFSESENIEKVIGDCYDEAMANQYDLEQNLGVVSEAKKEVYKWQKAPSKEDLAIVKSFGFTPAEGGDVGGDPLLWANEADHYGLMLHWLDHKGMWMAELNDMDNYDIPAQEMEQDGIPTKEFIQGAIDLHNELLEGADDITPAPEADVAEAEKNGWKASDGNKPSLIWLNKDVANMVLRWQDQSEYWEAEIYKKANETNRRTNHVISQQKTQSFSDFLKYATAEAKKTLEANSGSSKVQETTMPVQQSTISEAPKFETYIKNLSYIQRRDGKEFPDDTWTGVIGKVVQAGRMRDDRHIYYRPVGSEDKFTLFFDVDEVEPADNPPSLSDVQRIKRQKHLAQLAAAAQQRANESTRAVNKNTLCEGIKRRLGIIV